MGIKIVKQSFEIVDDLDYTKILKKIERCGRVCYKSEARITEDSAEKFVANLIKRGHESVLEHESFTVRFVCDRAVSHQLVRHRLASYSQESMRYCNYKDEMTFIESPELYTYFIDTLPDIAKKYSEMIRAGEKPEVARAVLPHCIKTEMYVTMNLRGWRHFLKTRVDKTVQTNTRELGTGLLLELQARLPVFFNDITIQ